MDSTASLKMAIYFRQQRDRWLRAAVIADGVGRRDAAVKWFGWAQDYETDANEEMRTMIEKARLARR